MLAVRQLEGRIGADSAASYVDLGQRASRHTHTHRVELHSWPASSRPVAVPRRLYRRRTRIPQPADSCLVV